MPRGEPGVLAVLWRGSLPVAPALDSRLPCPAVNAALVPLERHVLRGQFGGLSVLVYLRENGQPPSSACRSLNLVSSQLPPTIHLPDDSGIGPACALLAFRRNLRVFANAARECFRSRGV